MNMVVKIHDIPNNKQHLRVLGVANHITKLTHANMTQSQQQVITSRNQQSVYVFVESALC